MFQRFSLSRLGDAPMRTQHNRASHKRDAGYAVNGLGNFG
jgi:hypothetical protein